MRLKERGLRKSELSFFELLGSDENALSKSFAFLLASKPEAYFKFINFLGIKQRKSPIHFRNVIIEIQYFRKEGITDIELSFEKNYHIIIECKIKGGKVTRQRRQYLTAFKNVKKKVLCFITQERDTKFFSEKKLKVNFVTWLEILSLFDKKEYTKDSLFQDFFKFVHRKYSIMSLIKEVLIQDLGNAKEIRRFLNTNIYARDETYGNALYFAPYFTRHCGQPEGIGYISKVLGILTLSPQDIDKFSSDLNNFTKDSNLIKKWVKGVKEDRELVRKKTYYFLGKSFKFKSPLKKVNVHHSTNWIGGSIPKNRRVNFIDILAHVPELSDTIS